MTSITLPRATVEQALEALEWHYRQGHSNTLGGFRLKIDEKALRALRAALAQQAEPDLSRCPQCNGPADNGFDRSFPPSPYLCTKCMAEPVPGAWVASPDGRVIYDDVSADDGLLRVSGDFENDEQRFHYAKQIVDKLNASPPKAEPVPLTEEEIDAEWHELDGEASALFKRVIRKFARAVEKASWEKNHGQA